MSTTAILIFARSSESDYSSKPLGSNHDTIAVFSLLNKKIISIARKTGLSFFLYDEHRQTGSHFGYRLANAISAVYAKGFDRVIVVGNDCPELCVKHVKNAAALMDSNPLVLGPDYRGGVYIIGIDKTVFDYNKFVKLPWQTRTLYHTMLQHHVAAALPALHDIETIRDVALVLPYLYFKQAMRAVLRRILSRKEPLPDNHISSTSYLWLTRDVPLRAPPACL